MLSQKSLHQFIFYCGHLLFWFIVYVFYTYFLGYGSSNVEYVNLFSYFLMPITIAISYWFIIFLIPKYLLTKKYKLFCLYTLYTLIISFTGIIFTILYAMVFLLNENVEYTSPLTKTLPFIILGIYFIVLISVAIGLMWYTYKNNLKNEELKHKFTQTQLQLKEQEIRFLKLQIHPHFLFNTLNTIYGLSLIKADQTPETILKLSNLLDYILYQVDKPLVLLSNEIKHLKDYINLEEIRFSDTLIVNFKIEIEDESLEVPPMLFITFVENAFKHGSRPNGKLKVDINLNYSNKILYFEIINPSENSMNKSGGIGLENIKKRLKIIFPNKHILNINRDNKTFKVSLKLDLN